MPRKSGKRLSGKDMRKIKNLKRIPISYRRDALQAGPRSRALTDINRRKHDAAVDR
jgi:hypothetical protein